jgi:hypothetical protein
MGAVSRARAVGVRVGWAWALPEVLATHGEDSAEREADGSLALERTGKDCEVRRVSPLKTEEPGEVLGCFYLFEEKDFCSYEFLLIPPVWLGKLNNPVGFLWDEGSSFHGQAPVGGFWIQKQSAFGFKFPRILAL